MKNLVMTAFHQLELLEEPIPEPGKGEAVIRVKYGGICGSDLHILAGQHPTAKPPMVLGHEFCGELYKIDSDARSDLAPGDFVASHLVVGCGVCEYCASGRENLCRNNKVYGASRDGFYTQYVKVPASRVVKFGQDVDLKTAALIEPLTVAVHDVRRSRMQAGDDVFIAGCGAIGILIALVARLNGAARIVLAELDPHRIALGKEFGFDVLDISDAAFEKTCMDRVEGRGYDRVFEVTGVQGGFDICGKAVKAGGTVVQVGMPNRHYDIDISKYIFSEVDLLGVRQHTYTDFCVAAKLINDGLLQKDLCKMVSAVYPMDKAAEAFAAAQQDKSLLKILLDFT